MQARVSEVPASTLGDSKCAPIIMVETAPAQTDKNRKRLVIRLTFTTRFMDSHSETAQTSTRKTLTYKHKDFICLDVPFLLHTDYTSE